VFEIRLIFCTWLCRVNAYCFIDTKQIVPNGNISGFCSGGVSFESWPKYQLFWVEVYVAFLSASEKMPGKQIKLITTSFFTDISLQKRPHFLCGPPASCSVGTGGAYSGGREAEVCRLPLSSPLIVKSEWIYKVVQIWPGLTVCKLVTICSGHI
jgi:hypothetical protein